MKTGRRRRSWDGGGPKRSKEWHLICTRGPKYGIQPAPACGVNGIPHNGATNQFERDGAESVARAALCDAKVELDRRPREPSLASV